MINHPELKRPLTEDEALWLDAHDECLCDLTDALFVYGASNVYDLRKSSTQTPKSFFSNFVLRFENNIIELWSASSVETLSKLVE